VGNIVCPKHAARKQSRSGFFLRHAIFQDDGMDSMRDLGVSHYFTKFDFAHLGLGLEGRFLGAVICDFAIRLFADSDSAFPFGV